MVIVVPIGAFGDGVPAMAAPGVAATQPTHGEPRSPSGTVDLERLHRVRGAARLIAARRRSSGANPLVEDHNAANQARRNAHRAPPPDRRASRAASSCFTSFLSSSGLLADTSGPAATNSTPGGTGPVSSSAKVANTARSRRRSRFRSTAPPTRLVIAYATRVPSSPPSSRKVMARGPRRTRTPCVRSATKVRRSRTGRIRPTAWPDPSDDGSAGRSVQPSWTSACGSRGSSPACGRWAERCASLFLLGSCAPGTAQAATRSAAARCRLAAPARARGAIRATLRPRHPAGQSRVDRTVDLQRRSRARSPCARGARRCYGPASAITAPR